MNKKATFLSGIILFAMLLSGCSQTPASIGIPLPASTVTDTHSPTSTATTLTSATATPVPAPRFTEGGQPFKFIGSFVPPYYFSEIWSEQSDDELMQSARKNGITVFIVMLPLIEPKLGVFDENTMVKIDHFLDTASQNNIYVMISFIHAYGLSLPWSQQNDPYFSPNGIDELINNPKLAQAFKNRIQYLLTRKNSINGKTYKDDPVIFAWLICHEPITAPFNYPAGQAPRTTITQLRDWLDATTAYVKSLDPNHLVSVSITSAINSIQGGNWGDWIQAVNIPSMDFFLMEDSDIHPLEKGWPFSDWAFTSYIPAMTKPVVIYSDFASNIWNLDAICKDYAWQAQALNGDMRVLYAEGASGIILWSWESDSFLTHANSPRSDACTMYTDSTTPIVQMLPGVVKLYNPSGLPTAPLQFVKAQPGTPATHAVQASSSAPAWTNLGLKGLGILALVIDPSNPSTLYAGQMGNAGNGVYQSNDGGGNWQQFNNGLTNPDIRAIALDPKIPAALLAGSNYGLFKTTDGGQNWSNASTGLTNFTIMSLAVDPGTPATLYAGTYGGAFTSKDGGAHWSGISSGLVSNYVFTLAVDPGKPDTLYAGTYMGVYKSINGGGSWSPANDGMADAWVFALAFDPTTSTTLYAGTDEGVYKSTDGGAHWNATNSGLANLDIQALAVDQNKPSTLYAGTFEGVYASTDGGTSWNAFYAGLAGIKVYALVIDPNTPTTIYAGTSNGVFVIH